MSAKDNYLVINKKSWNNRVESHLASDFYDVKNFLAGESSLKAIELDLLGDLQGKSVLHLQCHFGQDSISLARLGAEVTGVDLSDKAIEAAHELAKEDGAKVDFICCDLYDLPNHLDKQFDLVFASYGTIPWLPDLDKWAAVVTRYLKPQGKFVFVEFHPVVWMFDDSFDRVGYSYFNTGSIIEEESGTYADKEAQINQQNVVWNHGLGEVMTSLLNNGLTLQSFREYDYSPYNIFEESSEIAPGQFRVKKMGDKLPLVYSLVMKNEAN